MKFVHQALRLIKKHSELDYSKESGTELEKHFRSGKDDLFYWIAWYFIDRSGLIEHGSNVGRSWLTKEGETFLQYLDNHPMKQVIDPFDQIVKL